MRSFAWSPRSLPPRRRWPPTQGFITSLGTRASSTSRLTANFYPTSDLRSSPIGSTWRPRSSTATAGWRATSAIVGGRYPRPSPSRRLVRKTRGGAGTRIRSSGATLPSPVESTRRSPWRQKDKPRPCWRPREGPTSSAMMAPTRRTRRKTAWCWHCRAPRLRKTRRLRRRLLKNTSPMRRR